MNRVLLLEDWDDDGTLREKGRVLELDERSASDLIQRGVARSVTVGPTEFKEADTEKGNE